MVNARIRKAWINGADVYRLGIQENLTYDVKELGVSLFDLQIFLDKMGSKKSFWTNTIFLVGYSFLNSKVADTALNTIRSYVEKFNSKFLVLHQNASAVGSLDLGFETDVKVKQELIKETKTIYNLSLIHI